MQNNGYIPGTGGAYLLPGSNALNGLSAHIADLQAQKLLDVKAKKAANDQMQKDYMENQIKAQSGGLFSGEYNKYVQAHIDKGAKYLSQGFDVYRPDPNKPDQMAAYQDYMSERHKLDAMGQIAKDHTENYNKQLAAAQTGKYDEDSVNALHGFYDTKNNPNRLAEIYDSGATAPSLMPAFDQAAFLKGIHPAAVDTKVVKDGQEITQKVPNMAAIKYNTEAAINSNPQAQRYLTKQTGINPANLYGTTDPKELNNLLDDYYRSPTGAKEIAKANITSYDSPEYGDFLSKKLYNQLGQEHGWQNAIGDLTKIKANEVDPKLYVTPNHEEANFALRLHDAKNADQRLALENERMGYTREDHAEKADTKTQRDKFLKGLLVGNTEQVQDLKGILKSKGGDVAFLPNGDMAVKWQQRTNKTDANNKPVYEMHRTVVDLSGAQGNDAYAHLNEILNNVTGNKMPLEKVQALPEYKGGLVNIGKEYSLKPEQIKYIREKFGTDHTGLAEMFYNNKAFPTKTEAMKAAIKILDKTGHTSPVLEN